jgi:hypothetical protein
VTLAQAQAAAMDLRTALLDNGVPRVSIELQPGVGPKADPWGVAPFKRVLSHHVASYPPGTPGLGIVKGGRGGKNPLTGPLANCYGGFDLTARIITLGWANHPGEGGPWTVPGWGTVPRNNGRPYLLGWEFEGGYLDYTDEMHDFMASCGAGSLDWLGTLPGNPGPAPLECHDEHLGWAGTRKVDRKGYTTASGRSRIAAVRGTRTTTPPPSVPEDDMPQFISAPGRGHALVWPGFVKRLPGGTGANQEELEAAQALYGAIKPMTVRGFDVAVALHMNVEMSAAATAAIVTQVAGVVSGADVDEQALGQSIVTGLLPQLTLALADDANPAEMEAAVRRVFADAAGGLGAAR